MKKIVLWTLVILTPFLASCGLSKEKPQEVLKQTQVNFANSFNNTLFNTKQWTYNMSIKANVTSPMWNWNADIKLKWEWNEKKENKWNANISVNYDFNWQKGDIKADLDYIIAKSKYFYKLNSFISNSQDPRLAALAAYSKNIEWKWLYTPRPDNGYNDDYKKINFVDKLKKYSLFKVNKVLWARKYEVSLDKDNIAQMVYEINQDFKQWTWLTVDKVKSDMTWFDISWVIEIKEDKKHFVFSWNVLNDWKKDKIVFKNLSDKFYFEVNTDNQGKIVLDVNKDGDKFKWTFTITQNGQSYVLNISWQLTKKQFDLNISTSINWINANIQTSTSVEEKKDVKIKIPQDAVSLQQLQQQAIEQQSNWTWTTIWTWTNK